MISTAANNFVTTLAGVKMPKIIYGTAWKKERTTDLVVEAILSGFRGIDTACQPKHYQEHLVGEAVSKLSKLHKIERTSLYLQTKFTPLSGQDPNNIPYEKGSDLETQVKQSLKKSLENLQTDYIDSLVLHSPLRTLEETLKVWRIFEEFYAKGTVKQLGISNIYSIKALDGLWKGSTIKPAVVQNRFYEDTKYDREIREFCRSNGVFYQSFWTLTANPHILGDIEFKKIANKRKCTVEQLFFKFVMQLGIVPLTGTKTKEHMMEDLDVLNMEDLSSQEMTLVKELIGEL